VNAAGHGGVPGAAHPLLAAAVLVRDRGGSRVLLVRRGPGAAFGDGLWDLPVGKAVAGEPVTEAAARELREETGLEAAPDTLRVAHVIHGGRSAVAGVAGFLTVVLEAPVWRGEPVNGEPHKHSAVRWWPLDGLPRACVPSSRRALESWRDGGNGVTLWRFGGDART
jgi:8-oxo-dGTP pyrophosphatase MutT (NUDIX family)